MIAVATAGMHDDPLPEEGSNLSRLLVGLEFQTGPFKRCVLKFKSDLFPTANNFCTDNSKFVEAKVTIVDFRNNKAL